VEAVVLPEAVAPPEAAALLEVQEAAALLEVQAAQALAVAAEVAEREAAGRTRVRRAAR
jgi:hypothetical protein